MQPNNLTFSRLTAFTVSVRNIGQFRKEPFVLLADVNKRFQIQL